MKVKNHLVISTGSFIDWCGHNVYYRITQVSDGSKCNIKCEVDEHNLGEWRVYGDGNCESHAINKAISEWNEIDRNR